MSSRSNRAAFTLVEMLVVIAIIAILMAMIGTSLVRARELARRTKAETQLREMISAWLEYYEFYSELNDGRWPADVHDQQRIEMTYERLDALIDPENAAENPRGIVLLACDVKPEGTYLDPWGTPYQLSFRKTGELVQETGLRTSVSFANRKREMGER